MYNKNLRHAPCCVLLCFVILGFTASIALGQNLNEAKSLFEAGQYSQAEAILKQLYKQDNKNAVVNLYLGKVYIALEKYDQAEDYLKKALDRDKNLADAHFELGNVVLARPRILLGSRNSEARRHFEKGLKIDPTHANIKFALFESYFNDDDPKKAYEILSEYVKENPGSTRGYMAMARLQGFYEYNMKLRLDLMREFYVQAFSTNPENSDDLFEIGWGLFMSDDIHGARLAHNGAEFLAKDISFENYMDMMVVAFENLDYGTSRIYFEEGLKKAPPEKRALFTDIKNLPRFLVDNLAAEFNVSPEQFLDPDYRPDDQRLYIKQLYHFAIMWTQNRSEIKRNEPVSYTGSTFFEQPYLLYAGLHNHLDYAFYFYLTESEMPQFLLITNQYERAEWRKRWFRSVDPTPTDNVIEPEEEFLRRVDFIYENFKILPNKHNKDWHANELSGFDDRGKVYLKYGPPTPAGIYYDLGGTVNAETMDNPLLTDRRYTLYSRYPQTTVKANQSWVYTHLDNYLAFDFVEINEGYYTYVESLEDAIIGGKNFYRLYLNENRADIGGPYLFLYEYFREILNKIDTRDESTQFLDEELRTELLETGHDLEIPEFNSSEFLFDFMLPEVIKKNAVMTDYPTNVVDIGKPRNRLPMLLDLATFRGEDGNTRVEVYTAVEYRNLGYSKESDDKLLAFLDQNVVVKDKNYLPVARDNAFTTLLVEPDEKNREMSTVNQFIFELIPEEYIIYLDGNNIQGNKESVLERPTNVRDYHIDDLILSDIQLSLDIQPASAERNKFVKNGLSVVPYPYRVVDRSKDIFIYYEIYGLTQRPNGSTSYNINTTLTVYDPNNTLINAMKSLFPGTSREPEITSSDTRSGTQPDAVEYIAFDLTSLMPGKARLQIEIVDNVSGKKAVRIIVFDLF